MRNSFRRLGDWLWPGQDPAATPVNVAEVERLAARIGQEMKYLQKRVDKLERQLAERNE